MAKRETKLERPRCGAFKIDSCLEKPASVTGAFKFIFRSKPVWSAAKMGAGGRKSINSFLDTDDPCSIFFFPALIHHADFVIIRKTRFERALRLKENIWKHKPKNE